MSNKWIDYCSLDFISKNSKYFQWLHTDFRSIYIFCKHRIPWVSVEITHEKKQKLDQNVALLYLKQVLPKSSSFKRKLQRSTDPHSVLPFCFQNPPRCFFCFSEGLPPSISSHLFCFLHHFVCIVTEDLSVMIVCSFSTCTSWK